MVVSLPSCRAIVTATLVGSALFMTAAAGVDPPKPFAPPPGRLCTPADPDFDGYVYASRVAHCRHHVTPAVRASVAGRYGVTPEEMHLYAFDHYLPLVIGGADSEDNLWPLAEGKEEEKSRLDMRLGSAVAGGEMTQEEAVREIRAWGEGK